MLEVSKIQIYYLYYLYYLGIPLTISSITIYLIFGLSQLPLSAILFVLGFILINIGYWGNVYYKIKFKEDEN